MCNKMRYQICNSCATHKPRGAKLSPRASINKRSDWWCWSKSMKVWTETSNECMPIWGNVILVLQKVYNWIYHGIRLGRNCGKMRMIYGKKSLYFGSFSWYALITKINLTHKKKYFSNIHLYRTLNNSCWPKYYKSVFNAHLTITKYISFEVIKIELEHPSNFSIFQSNTNNSTKKTRAQQSPFSAALLKSGFETPRKTKQRRTTCLRACLSNARKRKIYRFWYQARMRRYMCRPARAMCLLRLPPFPLQFEADVLSLPVWRSGVMSRVFLELSVIYS